MKHQLLILHLKQADAVVEVVQFLVELIGVFLLGLLGDQVKNILVERGAVFLFECLL